MATAPRLSRSERTALTRRELLVAAELRFFRDGYHGTTLDDVADEAGYTKGAVYSTFKSKGGLVLALFDEIVDRRVEELRRLLALHPDDDSKLKALAEQPVDERNSQFLLLTIEFWVHAARDPALLDEFARSYRRLRAKLAELAPEHSSFDAEQWALVTLALSNGLALERLIDPAGVPSDLMASVQRRLLARGAGSLPRERSRVFPLKDDIPTDRPAVMTIAFMVINVLVYFLLQKGGIFSGPDDASVVDWGAIPFEFTHLGDECVVAGEQIACGPPAELTAAGLPTSQPATWVTAFSSMFMHGGIVHLGGNMLFLWIFGNNVEDSMGPVKFVAFYLLGGLAALAAQIAIEPNAAVPTIGASGAVAAVLGGYILLYPKARVITLIFVIFFFTIVELPAMMILGFWFLLQVAFGAYGVANPSGGGGGIAYFAHIGGFAFGLLAIKLFASRAKDYSPPPKYPVY